MSAVTRAAPHLSVDEVQEKLRSAPSFWLRQRWMVIYTALIAPRPAGEIAKQLGVSKAFVAKINSLYKRFGPQGIETVGPGGRRNDYLSVDEERIFLAPFIARAETGELATVSEIHRAFEAHVGSSVDESTIYRLLARHEWRKVVPRGQHPKADETAQDAFKKTSLKRSKRR
jgi:transposase